MIQSIECETVTVNPAAAEVIDPQARVRLPDEFPPRDPVLFEYELVNRTDEQRTETVTARVGDQESALTLDIGPDTTMDVAHEVDVSDLQDGLYATEIEGGTLPVTIDTGEVRLQPLRDQTPTVECAVPPEVGVDGVLDVEFVVTNPFDQRLQFDLATEVNGEIVDRFRATADSNGSREGSVALRFEEPGEVDVGVSLVAGRLI